MNFSNRQTAEFDEYGESKRKLLARVDSEWYTKSLERRLVADGVDVEEYMSKMSMSRKSMVLGLGKFQDDAAIHRVR